MVKLRQILLLIWKNFKLQLRHPWVTLLELGVPAFFSLCLVLIRTAISSEYVSNPTMYDPFSVDSLPANLTPKAADKFKYNTRWEILHVPKDGYFDQIMSEVAAELKVGSAGFTTENEMVEHFLNSSSNVLSGIVFDPEMKDGFNGTSIISYKIRPKAPEQGSFLSGVKKWYTDKAFMLFSVLGPRNKDSGWGGTPGYMDEGFLPVQHSIAKTLIRNLLPDAQKELGINVELCRYPYPPYLDDRFLVALQMFFPMIICFSFIYPAVNIVKNIVIEKEKRLKESMKMMGLSKWLHWTAWYLKYFLFLCLSSAIITILLCVKFNGKVAVINGSDPSAILIWMLSYSISIIAFCFLLSTIFSKANSAAAGVGVIFFLTFIPYFFILPRYDNMSVPVKIISCLIPNLAIAIGSILLTVAEATGTGVQWYNIEDASTPDDSLSFAIIIYMFLVDAVICLVLAWYIEAVFPGEYGIPEPWYFPFTRSYWCGNPSSYADMAHSELINSEIKQSDFFERDPDGLMAGIQIQGLTKVFRKDREPAVNNLYLNMYRSHITVLLGHNGAGKTTAISMLTGLITPTSGSAIVNGFDICEDIDSVHSNLGICPQHDILFDELTVEEHLYFFCKLKGYIADLVPSEIDRIIACLNMEEKRNTPSAALSGGWKRKLSVGIALVGGSRIVILDEPTSGMDPFNRRQLWEVLQSEKEDRTILLTTHFMEEADVLGDRIAIMADGQVQCSGSPLFLKKKYGAGYHLVMVKEPACNVPVVTNLIKRHVPNAEMSSDIGTELKYILPHESSSQFYGLFLELENSVQELGISGYGASITTMEEVFIKVGQKRHTVDIPPKESLSRTDSGIHVLTNDDANSTEIDLRSTDSNQEDRNVGFPLFLQHLFALLLKRILHSVRNWSLTLSQLLLPPFFLIITFLVLKTLPKPHDEQPLPLNLAPYKGTIVPYSVGPGDAELAKVARLFAGQFSDHGEDVPVLVDSGENLTDFLIRDGVKDIKRYNMHNIASANFEKKGKDRKVTAFFNNQAFHSPAISLVLADTALLKYYVNQSFSFEVINHPLPRTLAEKGKQQQAQATESFQIAQDIMFGMSFLVASFAVFLVKERASNSKHLQRVTGLTLPSYWLASFIWDLLNYLVPCCLLLVVFAAFNAEGFSTKEQQGRLFLLFFIHAFSALPFVYCCSFLFYSSSTAYVRLSLFNILAGIACLLTVTILEIPDLGTKNVAVPLDYLFSILFPNFSLGRAINNLYQNYQFNKFCNHEEIKFVCEIKIPPIFDLVKPCCKGKCDDVCVPWEENYLALDSPGIGKHLIFFSVQSVVFVGILILCEYNFLRYLRYKIKSQKIVPVNIPSVEEPVDLQNIEDDDVKNERLRISNTLMPELFNTYHLIVRQVSKNYGTFVAVDRLSFGVRKGECFGLLGLNGAGKTTTFKMITGDESLTSGDIFVNGFNIKKQSRKVQQSIGYCPQFDALIDELTGKETLALFARLRGIPENLVPDHIEELFKLLMFGMYKNQKVSEYSGGNKRKLSTAIALLGNPPVVFLDEPTTGMDPVSRRYMWSALLQVIQAGRSVVLTSHSMEECEALCSRLVIMVNGRLCCLGSPQHLKSKFGEGFTLMVKVGRRPSATTRQLHPVPPQDRLLSSGPHSPSGSALRSDADRIRSFVTETFSSAQLIGAHDNLLHFHIPTTRLAWSGIFRAMEEAKQDLNIEDYSVGQTTLEQVFLDFAMTQRDETSSEAAMPSS